MSFTVVIPISNPGPVPQKVTIPKGTLVQVNASGCQNVVLAKTVVEIVPPNQTVHVKAEAFCVNQFLGPPNAVPGNLTKWTFPRTFSSQDHVWGTLGQPAAAPNPATMPTIAPGVSMQQVLAAIRNAYTEKTLKQMLHVKLGVKLFDKVAAGSFDDVTFDLLVLSEQEGWQGDLVRNAYEYSADQHPTKIGNPLLLAVFQQFALAT